jgi:hypothetical protein
MDDTRCRTGEYSRGARRRFRLLAALAAAAVLSTACSDSTGPKKDDQIVVTDDMCPGTPVPVCTDAAVMDVARDVASDGSGRSVLALENTAAQTAIAARLTDLNTALAGGNVTKTRKALTSARAAVDAARAQLASFGGDAPDLDSIELLLDHVASVVGAS